ncbi:type IV toxin-antitoxin system AbiEi family antitoxin domain-containing protein [Microbacterium sp. NPDC089696]|uniref:type IV toxin-antitoxin system AbiEi family antitoxin domain-containing protein n=1 Tax=Microbacterium sp. NPDC089696 TaxID=3364199 RepID=UPI0037F19344
MDVITELVARQGVARVSALRRSGVTEHALRRAVRAGDVVSVCRGWVAVRDADAMLVAAAQRGVVLSCITLAERRGNWVTKAGEPHVAAPPKSGHAHARRGVVHWSIPVFPRDPDVLEDSVENALILVARCQRHEGALATWESAVRQRLVDPAVLERVPLPPAARRVLDELTPFADAGTETILRTRLRWLPVPLTPQVRGGRRRAGILRLTRRTPPIAEKPCGEGGASSREACEQGVKTPSHTSLSSHLHHDTPRNSPKPAK